MTPINELTLDPARPGARATLTAIAVALSIALAMTVWQADVAAGHSPHPTNGCSSSPDYPNGWNFKASCDRHDLCYGHHTYGRSSTGRLRCDTVFHASLRRACDRTTTNPGCKALASLYYAAVRTQGCWAFWDEHRPWWRPYCPSNK